MEHYDLVVAGAGAAGLAHAFHRRRRDPGARVLVAEAQRRAGGFVRTVERDGYVCELGPQGFRPGPEVDALLDALGAAGDVVAAAPAAMKRWVVLHSRLCTLPAGPLQALRSPLLGARAAVSLCGEPWRARGDDPEESLAGFVARRFGARARPLAEALAHGIFAGDADRLEMASMFPRLVELERRHGSVVRGLWRERRRGPRPRRPALCSLRGGMAALVDRVAARLGGALALGTPVQRVEAAGGGFVVTLGGAAERQIRARELALALPAAAASALLAPLDPVLANELRQVRAASVASVWIGAPRAAFAHRLDGFGCLAPKHGSPLLGVLLCSSVFPHHAPSGQALLRVMTGGSEHPGDVERADGELLTQAVTWLRELFGWRGQPAFVHVERSRDAIPQFEIGHRRRLDRVAAAVARHQGLSLLGASYRQIAVTGQLGEAGSRP